MKTPVDPGFVPEADARKSVCFYMKIVEKVTKNLPPDHERVTFRIKVPREFYMLINEGLQTTVVEQERNHDVHLVTASKEKWLELTDQTDNMTSDDEYQKYLKGVLQTIRDRL